MDGISQVVIEFTSCSMLQTHQNCSLAFPLRCSINIQSTIQNTTPISLSEFASSMFSPLSKMVLLSSQFLNPQAASHLCLYLLLILQDLSFHKSWLCLQNTIRINSLFSVSTIANSFQTTILSSWSTAITS
jgi:hypothetical protein